MGQSRHQSDHRILSIDQLGSIWRWEGQLTWLVPSLLAEGSVNLISSASGTGKTWFAYFLAGAVAHGRSVFGEQVKQRKVVYVDGENPAYVVKQRLHDLGIPETPDLKVWGGWEVEAPRGPDNPAILAFAQRERPLLIWDSLVEFHTGEEQSSTATRQFMRQFRQLANLGATVVILHHTGKAESAQKYRGSSDIEAAVDMAYTLEATNKNAPLDQLTLEAFKCRLEPVPTRQLRYVRGSGFEVSAILAKPADRRLEPVEVVKGIVQAEPGLNQSDIVKRGMAAGISKHAVEEALKREDIFTSKRGRGNQYLCGFRGKAKRIPG